LISLLISEGSLDLTGVNDARGTTGLKYGKSLFFTVRGEKVVSRLGDRSFRVFLVRLALVNFSLLGSVI
jgi:hypothetical protein